MHTTGVNREIRLAVVMYGGTSLAIYMNGISQELLQLVRATSPAADPEAAMSNTARVYRKLAHVLGGTPLERITEEVLAHPPPLRFIVDILSGTSAGGINAVMLAKALARNADLEPLKRLWLQQGALEKLINDPRSSSPTRYPYREPVKALFQSDRMYVELLNAMEALNRSSPDGAGALVEDLDLVVTGTDLAGEVARLRLADGVVHEYDHKHTFTFRLAERGLEHDEFTAEHDPLLAFAARTTSSLPAAFEPAVVRNAQRLAGRRHAGAPWAKLFRSGREDTPDRQERRAFADGGYLDNKPFGHAIDRLSEAPSGVRVQRKLYYLEPAPERIDPEAPVALDDVPNALENTMKVVTLARYETIRADIQRIVGRNRLLDRIRTLGFGVLEDVPVPDDADDPTAGPIDPPRAPLRALVAQYGYAYGAYHRLRVARTTDALADTVADALRVPPDDDVRRALRRVASAWRNAHYQRNPSEEWPDAELEWDFLQRFDLASHVRRARYLLNRIDHAFVFDRDLVNELRHVVGTNPHLAALVRAHDRDDARSAVDAWSEVQPLLRVAKTMAQRAVFALDPGRGSGDATDIHMALRDLVQPAGGADELASFREALIAVLAAPTEKAGWQAAEAFLARHRTLIDDVAATIAQHHAERIARSEAALHDLRELEVSPGLQSEVRALLMRYWQQFRPFDMVQYPLLEATDVGHEFATVDVHRISPVDAGHYGQAIPDDKLYGARFASFGAFLDEGWRAHDIRWGRLDGAERLIATMLDDAPIEARDEVRERLVTEAHLAIVVDEFHIGQEGRKALRVERRTEDGGAELDIDATKAMVARFLNEQREGLQLDPRRTTDSLSRLVRVSGKLTDTLSTESRMPDAVRNLVGFASFAGANLLVAAIPKTFANLLASYWANLLLLFGAVLLLIDNPLWTLAPLGRGPVLGAGLILVALAFLIARALVWSALSPPRDDAQVALGPWPRRVGLVLSALGLVLAATFGYVATMGTSGPGQPDLLGHATVATALGFARTPGEVACILGENAGPSCMTPRDPGARPDTTAAARARTSVRLHLAAALWYALLLGSIGVTTWRTSSSMAAAGLALAAVLIVGAGWEAANVLATLETPYAAMRDAWLERTSSLAGAKHLSAFASILVMVAAVRLPGRWVVWPRRVLVSAVRITGAVAGVLGIVGLTLGAPQAVGAGSGILLLAAIGLAGLLASGYFGRSERELP